MPGPNVIQFSLPQDQRKQIEELCLDGESLNLCAKRVFLELLGIGGKPAFSGDDIQEQIDKSVGRAIARLIGDKIRPLEIRVEMLNHQLSQAKAIGQPIEQTIESANEAPNEPIEQTIEYLSSTALAKKLGVSKTTVLRWKKKSTISPDGKWEYSTEKQGWRSLD